MNHSEHEHWSHVDELPPSLEPQTSELAQEGWEWLATTFWTTMAMSLVVVAYAVLTWGAG